MQHKKQELMDSILEYADRYIQKNRKSPTIREIAEHVPLKRSAIHSYLVAMDEEGTIEYDGKTILTPKTRGILKGIRDIGIVGTVACGLPTEANPTFMDTIELPLSMVGDEEMYILTATGNSMIDAGIHEGDMILVRRQETANIGDIVVVWVENEGNTLKRFYRKGKTIILKPENSDMEDIRVKEEDCRIQGVAIWVLKKVGD